MLEVGYVANELSWVARDKRLVESRGHFANLQQIKYFKEKRIQDWKRDQTIAQIQKEDAEMARKSKEGRKSFFSS